jgi:alkylation response protein AidB-like acyl-CoA dehydrogenase
MKLTMTSSMAPKLVPLEERVTQFARQQIAARGDLQALEGFPFDLWQEMGKEGLLGLLLPPYNEGFGAAHLPAVTATETLAAEGGNLGLAFAFLIHLLTSRLIYDFGDAACVGSLLEQLATGAQTAALGISEPGLGAHPKNLQSSARREGDCYVLDGEKAYLSNGPIADLFIVLAVTSEEDKRKRFGAFLIPRTAAGLHLGAPMELGFLKPSQHCGLRLENCRVPATSSLGAGDTAYEAIAVPFREHEDVYLQALVCGGLRKQMDLLMGAIREAGGVGDTELAEKMGELDALIHALRLITYESAAVLDRGAASAELNKLSFAFRSMGRHTLQTAQQVIHKISLDAHAALQVITNDLSRTLSIAGSTIRLKQQKLGKRMIEGKASI